MHAPPRHIVLRAQRRLRDLGRAMPGITARVAAPSSGPVPPRAIVPRMHLRRLHVPPAAIALPRARLPRYVRPARIAARRSRSGRRASRERYAPPAVFLRLSTARLVPTARVTLSRPLRVRAALDIIVRTRRPCPLARAPVAAAPIALKACLRFLAPVTARPVFTVDRAQTASSASRAFTVPPPAPSSSRVHSARTVPTIA